jgi:hypothetical protein
MPLCKLSAEEAEHDNQKQLNLLAEQTAHHDAQRASEPSLNDSIQQIRLLESQVERQREALGDSDPETLEASHELSLESSTPEVDTWASHTPTLCAVFST